MLKLTRLVCIKHFAGSKEYTIRPSDLSVKYFSKIGYSVNTFLQLQQFGRSSFDRFQYF